MMLTRRLLEVTLRHRPPVNALTKSTLVLRDLGLLGEVDGKAILPADLEPRLRHGR
nr:hypothetical protein [Candidatus Freyrarchaeum guaymaensis]